MHIPSLNITNWVKSRLNLSFLHQENTAALSKKLIFFGSVLATTSAGYTFKASTLAAASSLPMAALVTGTILVIAGLYLYKNIGPVHNSSEVSKEPVPSAQATKAPNNQRPKQKPPEVTTTKSPQDNVEEQKPKDPIFELISEGNVHINNKDKKSFKNVLSKLCKIKEVRTLLSILSSDISNRPKFALFVSIPKDKNLFWKNASELLKCLWINHYLRVNNFIKMNQI